MSDPTTEARAAKPPFARGWPRGILIVLLLLVGLNAVAAGLGFVLDPDGSNVGIPLLWLEDSPFTDFRVPGALLAALGGLYLLAAVREMRRGQDAWVWAGLSGGAMVVWILVQALMMGSFRHPIQTTLQAAILVAGGVCAAMALLQHEAWKRQRRDRLADTSDEGVPSWMRRNVP